MSHSGGWHERRTTDQTEETGMKANSIPMTRPRQRTRVAIDHILVAVDFSDGSKAALRYAAQLAGAMDTAVTVVNVIEVNYGWLKYGANSFPMLDEQARENRKCTLQSFARECGAGPAWRYI